MQNCVLQLVEKAGLECHSARYLKFMLLVEKKDYLYNLLTRKK